MRILLSFLFFCCVNLGQNIYAQDIYRTQKADMLITAESADTILKISSKDILVLLNYESARFTIKMDISTFHTGVDSLDRLLALKKYEIIEFKGKLGIDRINTNGHAPLDFNVEGVISTNQNILKGRGHLEHFANRGNYSCMLTLFFNLNIADLGLNIEDLNLNEEIEIEIIESVLNQLEDY